METTKLIEQMAQKLGTTAEYLWGVLIKQASISAAINMGYVIFIIIIGIVLYRLNKYFNRYENGLSHYEEREGIVIIMIIGAVLWAIGLVVGVCLIGSTINAIFHPEYWALKQILNACK